MKEVTEEEVLKTMRNDSKKLDENVIRAWEMLRDDITKLISEMMHL